jgi:quercetin dioxygenase-like cupin family protein
MLDRRALLRTGGAAALGLTAMACAPAASDPAPPASSAGSAPTDGVTRTELQRAPSPAAGWQIVQTLVEIPEGMESGKHTHPGPEVGYIIQGDVAMEFEDRPTQMLHAGDPFLIPTDTVHNARNVGKLKTRMLSTYVIDETKPLVTKH